ncbi:MAG TPA: hypothetical protein PLS12_00660, partial [Bacteroidales bacterium]|nr:hypothetical protein [Bacteroidales bacterium]
MTHFALQSYKNSILYSIIYMIFGTFIALALQHIITICFVKIFIVAIVYTLSFAGLSIPLWMYVQYVDNAAQKELQ